jgi:3-deoxy-D-manno-octulosonic-acid transferase
VPGLWIYRGLTSMMGVLRDPLARLGRPGSAWREGWRGASEETKRALGSVWVHAASLGEVGAAAIWIEALLSRGARAPVLLTTRTRSGLDRAVRELGSRVAARIAPHDVPRLVREFLESAAPRRLDLVETEIWPNLIIEAGRRSVAVVVVSGSVSERTVRRLLTLGLAGRPLMGRGVYVLAQSATHAERFLALGTPAERIRVVGDLKADALLRDDHPPIPFAPRCAVVFGSLRPGEEQAAIRIAQVLERHRSEFGADRIAWAKSRGVEDPFEGRCRPVLVVAPRHRRGDERLKAALRSRGFHVAVRDESSRSRMDAAAWIDELSRREGPRAGILATHGELAAAYGEAWTAVVGGTFAPYGGHNVWEPAARGCPVLVGSHHEDVLAGVEALVSEGGGVVALDQDRHLEHILTGWLRDQDLEHRGASARRTARAAAGASSRALEALSAWGLIS